jgi:hypothetical protein
MDKNSLGEYVGHISQLLRVNSYRMSGGKSDGLQATDVKNGKLDFTVAADRGMDLPYVCYKGINLGYISPCGCVSPYFFDDKGLGFLRSFTAGFLTTCGLKYMGAPSELDGESYGLHGRIANIPAEEYSAHVSQDESGRLFAQIDGKMREAVLFGENLVLKRSIRCEYNGKELYITDVVCNEGFRKTQHMILYHFNIGYPQLDESTEIMIPFRSVKARNEHSQSGMDNKLMVEKPVEGYEEMCYFYKLKHDGNNHTCVAIYNHNLNLGLAIHFDVSVLDHFIQWKMMGKGEYVMGLEPANATPLGVKEEQANGCIKYLEAGEKITYRFKVQILDGINDLESIKALTDSLI